MAEQATPAATEPTQAALEPQPDTLLTTQVQDAVGDATQKTETKAEPGTEKDPKAVVPETYEFKAPEGTTLDPAVMGKFTPIFKEAGLTQEVAQKLVNEYASMQKAQADAWGKQQTDWAAEFKADKEFGGNNAEASLRSANAAWTKFATPEEIAAVHKFGLGNFPPMVKILSRVGKLMAEGEFHQGESTTTTKSTAEKFYPRMNP